MFPLNGNSTTTSLANGATFTGEWYDVTKQGYSNVVCIVFSDKSGLLYIDFSIDGSTTDETHTYSVSSNIGAKEIITLSSKYMRVRFTNNSGSSQSTFRLQAALSNSDIYQEKNYTTRIDEPSASVTYIGKAQFTASESLAVWQIKKMTVSGTVTSITWADGDEAFDNIWANRASLTYT